MALTPHPYILQFPLQSPAPAPAKSVFLCLSPALRKDAEIAAAAALFSPIAVRVSWRAKCLRSATEEDRRSESGTPPDGDQRSDEDDADDDDAAKVQDQQQSRASAAATGLSSPKVNTTSSYSDSLSLGIREPVYEVVEVTSDGTICTRKINRRHLLKSSGLRPRDIRSVDPSLFLTNSVPSLLVREHAILLNLGSLRAIAMQEQVLIFDYNR